jgi:hypothetical protein
MKQFVALLLFLTVGNSTYSQQLKRYPVGQSGCTALFYCDPGAFEHTKSKESSDVYTGKCTAGDMGYGIVCFALKKPLKHIENGDEMLTAYLDKQKKALGIISATGYAKGQRLKSNQDTRGILDYWKTKNGDTWKVECWTDGRYVAFMYASSKTIPHAFKADAFLGGLTFPGM